MLLEVQKVLKNNLDKYRLPDGIHPVVCELKALEDLKASHSIKYSIWEDQLVVLNYDHIESMKEHPISMECRSLVLELGTWKVVSRSFDRFFNYGEIEDTDVMTDLQDLTFHEKLDGSLVNLFSYKGQSLYRTRSVIMPTGFINGFELTWKEAIESCEPIGLLGPSTDDEFSTTYICELTCRENRVVVSYDHHPKLTLLAIRMDKTGRYYSPLTVDSMATIFKFNLAGKYTFNTIEGCLRAVKALPNLEEGYVGYNANGVPCVKIKNPAYVAAHLLRGEGLCEKRILDLILMNETDEYLALFPEDKVAFEPYQEAYLTLVKVLEADEVWLSSPLVEEWDQKKFALFIKDDPQAPLLFQMRKGLSWKEAFEGLTMKRKRDLILAFKQVE